MATSATAYARQLLEEFKPWVRGYNISAALLGVAFGAWDAPPALSQLAPAPETAACSTATPAERAWHTTVNAPRPPEVGLARQLLLTAPGVVLALRLGRRAR